jgi:protein TonB
MMLHVALLVGLFFVTGVFAAPEPPTQVAVVRAEPPAESELRTAVVPPEAPAWTPAETSATVTVEDRPDPEPEVFAAADRPRPNVDLGPPPDLPRSIGSRPIGAGASAPATTTGREAPRARPKAPPPAPPTRAVPTRKPDPVYPWSAVRRRFEGEVVLLVEVLPSGAVGEIRVTRSSGHAVLDEAAEEAVRGWAFRPALVRGDPVRSLVECPFVFQLE